MKKFFVNFLFKFKLIRRVGKKFLERKTIAQPFYSGKIYFNAIEYAVFWMTDKKCETVDRDIQDKLLSLSIQNEYFIDIGANIGIMTLSVAMRNPNIKVVAYDPNQHILNYLNRSIKENKLYGRVKTISAAVSDRSGKATMNFSAGPFSSHLTNEGTTVDVISLEDILEEFKEQRVLIKLDIEGFEKYLIPIVIKNVNSLHQFLIEIHPKGLNGISDPDYVLNELLASNLVIEDVMGNTITSRTDVKDWENIVCYYKAV